MKAPCRMLVSLFTSYLCLVVLATSGWTQTQATYFSYRMEQLKQQLKLTAAQQRELKPAVEQETSELMEIACNPATSREYKLETFGGILKRSESSMKSVLTAEQRQRLLQLHQQIMQELKTRKPAESCTHEYWGLN